MMMELDKSSDADCKDVPRNVEDEDDKDESPEETEKSLKEKDDSSEDDGESSEDDGESAEDFEESSDDDSYKGPVYDADVNEEGYLYGDATDPDFVQRVKRFCEKYESDKLFSYKLSKYFKGRCVVGGLQPIPRSELKQKTSYSREVADFAVSEYNKKQGIKLRLLKIVGHNTMSVPGLMSYLTLKVEEKDGPKLYRAQVYYVKNQSILGLFKPAPEHKLETCETCGQKLRASKAVKEAKITGSGSGIKRKAVGASDGECAEDNAHRKMLRGSGCSEGSDDKAVRTS